MGKVVSYTTFLSKWYMIFRLYTKPQKENSMHFINLVCTSFGEDRLDFFSQIPPPLL